MVVENNDSIYDTEEIKEIEKKATTDLAKILEEKPKLNSYQIKSIIADISLYYEFFSENDRNDLFKDFLEIYDDFILAEDKLNILLFINVGDTFRDYAGKNYENIKNQLEKIVFIPHNIGDELDIIDDFQYTLDCLYGSMHFKAVWLRFRSSIILDLYNFFGDYIKIFNGKELVKYDACNLRSMKFEDLEKLFFYETEKSTSKDASKILEVMGGLYKKDINIDLSSLSSFIIRPQVIDDILACIKSQYRDSIFNCFSESDEKRIISFYSKLYNEVLREKAESLVIEGSLDVEEVFSLNYLNALNVLATFSNHELVNSSLYLKCFKIFLKEFTNNYDDFMTEEVLYIVETLFRRVINKKSIISILSISNIKSLYHFFKTDEYKANLTLPLEMIKRSNSKQYKDLKNRYRENKTEISDGFCLEIFEDKEDGLIINLLDVFGYDLSKKLVKGPKTNLRILLDHVNQKSVDYIDNLKRVFSTCDISSILNLKNYSMTNFLGCFDILYEQGCKITLARLFKSLESLSYALIPSNMHINENLVKLNLVAKGDPLLEKVEGIKLYDKYRFRINSSIPDIYGRYMECNYSMVDLHSPEIISNGIGKYLLPNNVRASSCLTPNGRAASCLRHGAINPNGRFFKVEYHDKIVAYSWVWRAGDVICFDNIEVTEDLLKIGDYERVLYTVYKLVAEELINITSKKENRGAKLVILGRNRIDFFNKYFDNLLEIDRKKEDLFRPNFTGDLYLKDSSEKQLVLAGTDKVDISTTDVCPIYKYQRPSVRPFSDFDKNDLGKRLNSIYFDYCLKNNSKYQSIADKYSGGFIGEDWFIGIGNDRKREFYYRGGDERLFLEANKYLSGVDEKKSKIINVVHPEKEVLDNILNEKNIEIDHEGIRKYLTNDQKNIFNLSTEYYTHHPRTFREFISILEDNAITSSKYGNHDGGLGCNGSHFISVAKAYTDIYYSYLKAPTFIISSDICALSSRKGEDISSNFTDTSYPLRVPIHDGEYHVLNSICLDKVKAIFATTGNLYELAKIVYVLDLFENDLPIIEIKDNSYIDREVIKKYCKVRK